MLHNWALARGSGVSPIAAAKARLLAQSPALLVYPGVGIIGSPVSQWTDQSGNARHLLQATGANQPSTDGTTITTDAIAQFIKSTFTLNQPCTLYIRMKQVTWGSGRQLVDGGTGTQTGMIDQNSATPQLRAFAGGGILNTDLAVGVFGTVAIVFNGASASFRVNNNAAVTGNIGASNPGGLTLGSRADGIAFGNGQFALCAYYSTAHASGVQDTNIADIATICAGIA